MGTQGASLLQVLRHQTFVGKRGSTMQQVFPSYTTITTTTTIFTNTTINRENYTRFSLCRFVFRLRRDRTNI